jgi:hypothetical protein
MEAVVAQSRYHGGTHENNEEPQPRKPSTSLVEFSTIISSLTCSVLEESLVTQIIKKALIVLLYFEL